MKLYMLFIRLQTWVIYKLLVNKGHDDWLIGYNIANKVVRSNLEAQTCIAIVPMYFFLMQSRSLVQDVLMKVKDEARELTERKLFNIQQFLSRFRSVDF